uniref:Abi family protein n=1 Tax=Segatella copri TaxID=165179 RepID=UPI0040267952
MSRGLTIDNPGKAEQYLKTINYYRLSAYMYPLLLVPKSEHRFKTDASFRQVMMLYRFDKKLRLFMFNEIEKIEIAVRTAIVDECTSAFGDSFWMTNASYFIDSNKFQKTLALISHEIDKSHEEFIVHFKQTYSDPYPPAWILAEILPLGVMTNIFINLKDSQVKKKIAQRFGLQLRVFVSWMTIITVTRNACCHHARVWNKQNTLTPMNPRRTTHAWIILPSNPLRVYYDLCIIKYFLDTISPNNDMGQKLRNLLSAFPLVDPAPMGFPEGWENEELWEIG